ncbi:HNH/ENDO VII family nuclease [Clostridium kluyveri]|uniref:HNH/ENDO VII family nuclease n=1 Tax=Clostridium kluyveri TaxID=1534 RepID=UPI000A92477B|nr:HNH/ENDO VII family nuclease [Clostridium kluyveri]UZQ51471.1 HNH/ENDO VII family nuclease [Clostridium kluyveri]
MFDPNTISSWKVKGKTVTGTNVERMASGRAPIGYDGKTINLHHLTQTQSGSIAEVSQSFHQKNYSTIHINTGELPSGINRGVFDTWREDYWINKANDFTN